MSSRTTSGAKGPVASATAERPSKAHRVSWPSSASSIDRDSAESTLSSTTRMRRERAAELLRARLNHGWDGYAWPNACHDEGEPLAPALAFYLPGTELVALDQSGSSVQKKWRSTRTAPDSGHPVPSKQAFDHAAAPCCLTPTGETGARGQQDRCRSSHTTTGAVRFGRRGRTVEAVAASHESEYAITAATFFPREERVARRCRMTLRRDAGP